MMRIISCLAQLLMSGLILVLSFLGGMYENPKYFLIGVICAVAYFVTFNLAAEVSFSIRDYFVCSQWELFRKKFAWANIATFIIFTVCYIIFIQ